MAKYLDYDGFVYALGKLVEDLDIPDVSNYVKFTDLASSSKAGVIKISSDTSLIPSGDIQALDPTADEYSKRIYGLQKHPDGTAYVVVPWESGSGGSGISTEDQEFIDMLKKYMAETNPNLTSIVSVSALARFFGELYNDNAGIWNGDTSKDAGNFYIYDFDSDIKLFDQHSFRISYASASYPGVMSPTDKTHLDDLWTAYESGALGGGDGDINLSSYASKTGVVKLFNQMVNEGYALSWDHSSSTRKLNLRLTTPDDFDSGDVSEVTHSISNFNVVESDDIISIKVLTSAEYSALASKDSNTMYCITD